MAQLSAQVLNSLRPRTPSACSSTTMASLWYGTQTPIASVKVSPGFWCSAEFNSCRLSVLGSDRSRNFSVVRDSAERSEGGVAMETVGDNQVRKVRGIGLNAVINIKLETF